MPLLNKGKLNIEEHSLAVAATLPVGYLSIQPLGLGKGVSNRFSLVDVEIVWHHRYRMLTKTFVSSFHHLKLTLGFSFFSICFFFSSS